MNDEHRTQVWSCGGGVQSTAIAALIVQGRLPVPDLALIVDTGREKASTWAYLDSVTAPALSSVGLTLHRVPTAEWGGNAIANGNGTILLPVFSGDAKLPAFCSDRWKREVTLRWLRGQGVEACELWLGISRDEARRIRAPRCRWVQERYPLIFDVPMGRADCLRLVAKMGWPQPPRSSCWCCPNQGDREWRGLSEEDHARAVALEGELMQIDPTARLHRSLRRLPDVDWDSQLELISEGCETGYCYV